MSTFIDTNVFVYSISASPGDAAKRSLALALLAEVDIHLSLQVIQEFVHVCLRKNHLGMDAGALHHAVRHMLAYPCHLPGPAFVLRAMKIQQAHQTSYWDAAILGAAQDLGCDTLYSEDLNHGQDYDGVRVVNPFQS